MSEKELAGSVHYKYKGFVSGSRPCSHVVDVHLKHLPGLEEASEYDGDMLAGRSLNPLASERKHVVSHVALEFAQLYFFCTSSEV